MKKNKNTNVIKAIRAGIPYFIKNKNLLNVLIHEHRHLNQGVESALKIQKVLTNIE